MAAKDKVAAAAAKKSKSSNVPDLGATTTTAAATQPPATTTPEPTLPPTSPAPTLEVVPQGTRTPTKQAGGSAPPAAAGVTEDDVKKFKIKESDRDVRELIAEYVTVSEHGDALTIKENLPLEEFLPLLDYFTSLHQNTGFLIGDMLVAGEGMYKERLLLAMAKTGRSLNTLKAYLSVAKAIPANARNHNLGFVHHQRVAVIANNSEAGGIKKAKELLAIAVKGEDGKATEPMTTRDFAKLVEKHKPKAKPKAKPAKTGKRGPKTKAAKAAAKNLAKNAPRKLTEAETAASDQMHEVIRALAESAAELVKLLDDTPTDKKDLPEGDKGKAPTLLEVICKSDYATKTGFLNALPGATMERLRRDWQFIKDHQGYPK